MKCPALYLECEVCEEGKVNAAFQGCTFNYLNTLVDLFLYEHKFIAQVQITDYVF